MKVILSAVLLAGALLFQEADSANNNEILKNVTVDIGNVSGFQDLMIVHSVHLSGTRFDSNVVILLKAMHADRVRFPGAWVYLVDNGSEDRSRAVFDTVAQLWNRTTNDEQGRLTVERALDRGYALGALQHAAHAALALPIGSRPRFYALLQHSNIVERALDFGAALENCGALALLEYHRTSGWPCGQGGRYNSLTRNIGPKLNMLQYAGPSNGIPHGTFAFGMDGLDLLEKRGFFDPTFVSYHTKQLDEDFERFAGVVVEFLNQELHNNPSAGSPPSNCTANCLSPCAFPLFSKIHGKTNRRLDMSCAAAVNF